ncbi:MAG: hypothetical protein WC843_02800 [Candidatus Gracilibacteria bacterium]|jgi:hypothetical protein
MGHQTTSEAQPFVIELVEDEKSDHDTTAACAVAVGDDAFDLTGEDFDEIVFGIKKQVGLTTPEHTIRERESLAAKKGKRKSH